MTGRTTGAKGARGLGRALSALSGERPDSADILAHLVVDCAETCGAGAVAVLARAEGGQYLELLAASAHGAAEMDVWQAQHSAGPCVDAIDGARVVHSTAESEGLGDGALGSLMRTAGFQAVSAYPVAWRGHTLAGLNLFWSAGQVAATDDELGLVYADLVALTIAHPALGDPGAVQEQLRRTMAERAVVEQAKGVLAWTEGLDMGDAYARLLAISTSSGATLTEVAAEVVRRRGAPPT